jgi:aminoglycoside 6'-N-acetyltransferase
MARERETNSMTKRYHFRAATLADLPLLDAWFQEPHVREWWGEPEAFDAAELSDARVAIMIVECDGTPFGYMQDYDVHGWEGHHFSYLPKGSRGIDQFIGEAAMLDLGHGTAFIRQRMSALFAAGAPAIGTDPHPQNARAIAAYQKAGFRVVGPEEDTPWGRVVRMEAWAS